MGSKLDTVVCDCRVVDMKSARAPAGLSWRQLERLTVNEPLKPDQLEKASHRGCGQWRGEWSMWLILWYLTGQNVHLEIPQFRNLHCE